MEDDREAAIRARAFELWERSGQAHGQHDEHWRQAKEEIDGGAREAGAEPGSVGAPAAPESGETSAPRR